MGAVGVVAEYNPLHRGHLRHLALTRRAVGADGLVVVCMSGNWVQRGDCAVTDKWTRARQVCQHGADLVLELPTVFALASAPTFARGAVAILAAAGVEALSFGCEDPDLEALRALAGTLDRADFDRALRPQLDAGLSYPAARQKALAELVGPEAARLVERPNNNLAIEYLRALPVDITPLAIPRAGVHDGPMTADFPSASALRELLRRGDFAQAEPHLAAPWEGPVYNLKRLETAILCKLRQATPEALSVLPDGGDGLGQRLWRAAREARDLSELYGLAKTKRFTHARIRRLALWAALGLRSEDRPEAPGYLRVLAMTSRGAKHLAGLRGRSPLPIVTKSADARDLLATEARLTDVFCLCAEAPLPCGLEWRTTPAVL